MEEEFQEQLKGLEGSFMTERNLMTSTHDKQKKELKDMLAAMKAEAEEAISERRQVFEATREELKVCNICFNSASYHHKKFSSRSSNIY
ncbi:hypothetical protein M758_UG273100 [Ceratodon purpureus]|nr:hypothetical protein M758_UG273100 [Ceratodon purpureus]